MNLQTAYDLDLVREQRGAQIERIPPTERAGRRVAMTGCKGACAAQFGLPLFLPTHVATW